MKILSDAEKEELRHVVLEVLAVRHPAALPLHSVTRHVRTAMGFEIATDQVEGSLKLLAGFSPSLVLATRDELGSSEYWAATSAGVLHYERKK